MALEPITRQEQIIAGKELEPITRMEKFLKEYGGGSGGSSGPADWNTMLNKPFYEEDDGTIHHLDPKYIKDMYYESATNDYIVTETTLTIDADTGGSTLGYAAPIAHGKTYTVVYNGVSYECTAVDIGGAVALGNLSPMDKVDTGEPFMFVASADQGTSALMALDGSEEVVFSISGVVTIITPIPYKFMPEPNLYDLRETGLPTVVFGGVFSGGVEGEFNDLYQALKKGDTVKIKIKAKPKPDYDETDMTIVCGHNISWASYYGQITLYDFQCIDAVVYLIEFAIYPYRVDVRLRKIAEAT